MIGSLICMFFLGMGVMFCIGAIFIIRYMDSVEDNVYYPMDDDIIEMEAKYNAKHLSEKDR